MKLLKSIALVSTILSTSLWADNYKLDVAHSEVEFSVKHMMISRTNGDFKQYEGAIEYDGKEISSLKFDITIEVASIDTKIEKRDDHLRSADFFEAEKFPTIKFVSTAIKNINGKKFDVVGKLTVKGITKEVTIPMQFNGAATSPWGQSLIGLEGEFKIDRTEYGLTYSKALETGGLVVGKEITIEIQAEAIKQK
jgi:polyisoprenoid-binding protein YceI